MMLRSLALSLLLATTHLHTVRGGSDYVEDIETPPEDVYVGNDAGKSYATVILFSEFSYNNQVYLDCNGMFADTLVELSIGNHPVICTAPDEVTTVNFIIFVLDCDAPKFTSRKIRQASAVAAPFAGSAVVSYIPPPAKDNDDQGVGVVVECTPPPGSDFPIGKSFVSCTATDNSGNSVSVVSHLISVVEACNPNFEIEVNGACQECPDGKVFSAESSSCESCPKGYVRGNHDGSGTTGGCVPSVGICEVWEKSVGGKCRMCPSGKVGRNNDRGCGFCPDGQVRGNSAGNLASGCVDASRVCFEDEVGFKGKCQLCDGTDDSSCGRRERRM